MHSDNATFRARPRSRALVAASLAVASLVAQGGAARAGANVNAFEPSAFTEDLPSVGTTNIGTPLTLRLGLLAHYAVNPLGFVGTDDYGRHPVEETLSGRLSTDLMVAFAPFEYMDIGVTMPFVMSQTGTVEAKRFSGLPDPSGFALGDLRLAVRGTFLKTGVFRLGLQADGAFPTGDAAKLTGGGFGGGAKLLLDVHAGPVLVALNMGGFFQGEQDLGPIRVGSALTFGAGVSYSVLPVLDIQGESYGRALLSDLFGRSTTQLEALLAVRYRPIPDLALGLGGGGGTPIVAGYGTSQMRFFADVRWLQQPSADSDGDGLDDDEDACPMLPEDVDGFEDGDGCPDPDNDGDGVLDVDDKCPNDVEDKDGFQDDDGCPDVDNDGDGVPDATDKCPGEAEDEDGFQDDDGCPDVDNDGDGIPDAQDKCRDAAETKNGYRDDDGCPDFPGVHVEGDRIELDKPIRWKKGKVKLAEEYVPGLRSMARLIKANPSWSKVIIKVYTDDRGKEAKLYDLSAQRGQQIQQLLITEGVPFRRLRVKGMGPEDPKFDNGTKAGRAKNNRVEFIIKK